MMGVIPRPTPASQTAPMPFLSGARWCAPASAVAAACALAGCGPAGGRRTFEEKVVPVLETHCLGSTCHGVLPDSEARGETIVWTNFFVRILPDGRVADLDQAYERAKSRIDTIEHPELSTLLRKPLGSANAGLPHTGGNVFYSRLDPAYVTLRDWIAAEEGGGEGEPFENLTPEEQLFGTTVLPRLASAQCMNSGCHSAFAPFTAFEPPLAVDGELVFSTAAVRKNHHAARMHLFLGGDPLLSRLVRKTIPLERGGISHRGGNDIFFARAAGSDDPRADPAIAAIETWADAERAKALGGADPPALDGIVFVRGPVAAEGPFDHDTFVPGTDLWVLAPPEPGGALRNLTESAHPDGPADVRDPAVSHDATRVAFSMRTSASDGWNLYEIGLDGAGLAQLTFDAADLPGGGIAANVTPVYGPDGRVWFASTRAGDVAYGEAALDTDVWAVDPVTLALERWTYDPAMEVTPSWIPHGKAYGTLAFTMLRALGDRYEAAVVRGPYDHNKAYHGDPEIHIHHGITPPEEITYALRTMPDGRFVAALLDRTNVWRGGRLAVLDRQFGPDLPAGAAEDASVGGFRHAVVVLDEAASAAGPSPGGLYRHPVPLPDGRLLVTFAPGPLDLDDPAAAPEMGLYTITLTEDRAAGARPVIASFDPLLDEPGIAEYDAEPVVRRPLEDDLDHEPAWDTTRAAATGRVVYRHVETLEAIMSYLAPAGPKTIRDDLVAMRLVESVPMTPDALAAAPLGLGSHGRTRVLAEVPLAGGSVYADVPADVPFRVQFLDADGMAVGAQHNRWIHVAPGETFPGGVMPELFPVLCAGCHGALSGAPSGAAAPVPDVITMASVTLATYAGLDPRAPLAPIDATAGRVDVDFRRDVEPILARSCAGAGCHSGADPAGGLDLVPVPTTWFDTAYEALLRPGGGSAGGRAYVDEAGTSAYGSYLIERIYGRELGAPRLLNGACPGDPVLTAEERRTMVRWIDLGALYRGASE